MSGRHYSDQELLEMAYRSGQYRRQLDKVAEPFSYVVNAGEYFARNRSDSFYRQIAEWYQAGYNGLTLVPAQFQR